MGTNFSETTVHVDGLGALDLCHKMSTYIRELGYQPVVNPTPFGKAYTLCHDVVHRLSYSVTQTNYGDPNGRKLCTHVVELIGSS